MGSLANRMLVCFAIAFAAAASPAQARRCADTSGFAAAMEAVEASVPCAATGSHRRYVKDAVKALGGRLNGPCKRSFVRRFIKQSTCGRDGMVVCCKAGRPGTRLRNAVVKADRCSGPCPGAPASVGVGCTATGACVPTTTTTTTTRTIPPPPPTCGNGVIDAPTEECDGTDLGGRTCDCSGGILACTSKCKIDYARCPGARSLTLDFTNGESIGFCGEIRDASGTVLKELTCGGLNLGGGASQVPEGATPAGAISRFELLCTCSSCAIRPTSTRPAADTPDPDCTDTGCNFGTPLPILNPSIPALSVCAVNTWSRPASGQLELTTGNASVNVPLSSRVYLVETDRLDPLLPCPKCSAGGTPGNPGSGTCDSGKNDGQSCTSTNPQGLTRDCPPADVQFNGEIGIDLSPLSAEPVSEVAADGLFCPGQTDVQAGCLGSRACRSITVNGATAGALSPGAPADVTLGSVFCVPATGNGPIDGITNLPGPGAVSLPGQFLLTQQSP